MASRPVTPVDSRSVRVGCWVILFGCSRLGPRLQGLGSYGAELADGVQAPDVGRNYSGLFTADGVRQRLETLTRTRQPGVGKHERNTALSRGRAARRRAVPGGNGGHTGR